ncbi:MAG: hypothetical protein ABI832_10005 [bacterium]
MHNRLRLLRLATAVLYFGPLLAGLIGQGWAMVPVFVVILLLWSVIVRPHLWPASLRDLMATEALVAMAALAATQILLVVVLFAVGRGIGGVMAVQPVLPVYLPAALSFLSVPVSRLIWNPHVAAANVGFDPILQDVALQKADSEALAIEMLAQVFALPEDVPEAEVQQHLSAIGQHVEPAILRKVLTDAVSAGRAPRAGIKALIVHATDPEVVTVLDGSAYPVEAFAAAGRDADLIGLFARRCVVALGEEQDLALDCPSVGALQRAAQEVDDPAASKALQRLIGILEQGDGSQVAQA